MKEVMEGKMEGKRGRGRKRERYWRDVVER